MYYSLRCRGTSYETQWSELALSGDAWKNVSGNSAAPEFFSLVGVSMGERVRVGTGRYRAAIGLLTLASVFQAEFAKGQCREPANPKAEVAGQVPFRMMILKPPMTVVPDLSNQTLDEVKAEVENKLFPQTVTNNNPGWIVERQSPPRYSSVVICSPLELWLKMPSQQITKVPPIVGWPEGQIASRLADYHLRYAGSTPKESTAASGTIFDQDPKPGTPEPWGTDVIAKLLCFSGAETGVTVGVTAGA
jgi:hypothetical protein